MPGGPTYNQRQKSPGENERGGLTFHCQLAHSGGSIGGKAEGLGSVFEGPVGLHPWGLI